MSSPRLNEGTFARAPVRSSATIVKKWRPDTSSRPLHSFRGYNNTGTISTRKSSQGASPQSAWQVGESSFLSWHCWHHVDAYRIPLPDTKDLLTTAYLPDPVSTDLSTHVPIRLPVLHRVRIPARPSLRLKARPHVRLPDRLLLRLPAGLLLRLPVGPLLRLPVPSTTQLIARSPRHVVALLCPRANRTLRALARGHGGRPLATGTLCASAPRSITTTCRTPQSSPSSTSASSRHGLRTSSIAPKAQSSIIPWRRVAIGLTFQEATGKTVFFHLKVVHKIC